MRKVLALFAASVAAPAVAQMAPPLAGTRLDVVATGQAKRVPDQVIMTAGVVSQAATAQAAFAANAAAMARVLTAVRRAGVAERDLSTAQVSLSPQYRYGQDAPPTVTGYQANNSVTVTLRDVGRSGAVLDALVTAGANSINGPTLTVSQPEAALDEARTAAVTMARARAELYARAAGLRVGRIVAISEGERGPGRPIIERMRAMNVAATPTTEIAPGEQTLEVTLNVTFELQ